MNEQELSSRLRAAESAGGLAELAGEITAQACDAPNAMVEVWTTSEKVASEKARYVVDELGELTLRALLARIDASTTLWSYRLMTLAVGNLMRLRRRILQGLEILLDDETPLSADAAGARSGEQRGRLRVCDEAYLWIQRLAGLDDPESLGFSSEPQFLERAEGGRKAEIRRWRQSPIWENIRDAEL